MVYYHVRDSGSGLFVVFGKRNIRSNKLSLLHMGY